MSKYSRAMPPGISTLTQRLAEIERRLRALEARARPLVREASIEPADDEPAP